MQIRILQADGLVMSDDEIGATDRLLTYCRELIGSDAGDFLFYMEAEEGFSSVSLYHERDGGVYWVEPDGRLFNLADALWDEAPASRRWYEISLVVRADRIEVRPSFGEPPDFPVDEDRRDAIIRACFGEKPVYYPDEDDMDFMEWYRSFDP